MTPGDLCNFVVARQYSIVKELDDSAAISTRRVFLRRLLMSEFGGWLYSPVWRLALLARLAACFTRPFGGWLCSPVWRLRLRAGFGLDCGPKFWWAWIDSNYRPRPYQGRALAT